MTSKVQALESALAAAGDLKVLVGRLSSIADTFSQPKAELLSFTQVAKLLGIHRTVTLPRLVRDGVFKPVLCGKRWKISRDEVERVKRHGYAAVRTSAEAKKGRPPKKVPSGDLLSWRPVAH